MNPRYLLLIATVLTLQLSGSADTALPQKPMSVEACGYSTQTDGKTMSDLHREALADALQNAVIQANTEFRVEACTENMRLKEQTVRMISRGYIESSQTLSADFLPDSPSIYRIRIRARVLPLPLDEKKTP